MALRASSERAPAEAAPSAKAEAVRGVVRDVGGVLLSWAFVVVAEFVVIGATCRALFAGSWELVLGRKLALPIALAMVAPAALAVLLARLAGQSERLRRRVTLASVAAASAALLGVGVTEGRHFASLFVRAPFVAALALVAYVATAVSAPRAVRVLTAPRGRRVALVAGVAGAALFWLVDARVLPRLYPAFHTFACALTLAFAALTVLASRSPRPAPVPRGELLLGVVGLLATALALAWSPIAARRLARADNLRIVLAENAPLLGRAVRVAAWLAPPEPLVEDSADAASVHVGEVARALDWTGDDILLVSIDALRADHLGAYGYGRGITPNLDALANESAIFEHAYCPTPHTSYSVTSMMTGKAMRPLLSLGLGKRSDTWATYLRRYGYKTAAFYPPAVFYIDEDRFTDFEESGLGFEYRWVEFTSAEAKVKEVEKYLSGAVPEPLFVWVHLFEPHEPYVVHPGFFVGEGEKRAVDAYDSEVEYADAAVGALLRVVRAKEKERGKRLAVIVTADHGEEFGDHGGRYHGTTCYEEQVRVPLLVSAPGVVPRRVKTVVQTMDLLPTVLSAVGIPRPARVQGRDLGSVLAEKKPDDSGLAYAETDEQTLLARGDDRLLCARKIGACALYDLSRDPLQRADRSSVEPELARELRKQTAAIEREQGRYEASEVAWPDALRRGLQGDADAAEDVAALLDDARVVLRRKAAEVTFRLGSASVAPEVKRALSRDEDDEVRRWAALALVRMVGAHEAGDAATKADALLHDAEVKWRRAAALAFALSGDARGKAELSTWWRDEGPSSSAGGARLDAADAKELLLAIRRTRDADAVPALLDSLDYVPLRSAIVETLGEIGDARAKGPLLARLRTERYETARPFEARALLALGETRALLPPLTLFAGLPDPMVDALAIAREAGVLDAKNGGSVVEPAAVDVERDVTVRGGATALRVWVLAAGEGGELTGAVEGAALANVETKGAVHRADVASGNAGEGARVVKLALHEPKGVRAVWVVPVVRELPPFLVPRAPDAG